MRFLRGKLPFKDKVGQDGACTSVKQKISMRGQYTGELDEINPQRAKWGRRDHSTVQPLPQPSVPQLVPPEVYSFILDEVFAVLDKAVVLALETEEGKIEATCFSSLRHGDRDKATAFHQFITGRFMGV